MVVQVPAVGSRRQRRTVLFDAVLFDRRLDEAVQWQRARQAAGDALSFDGEPWAWPARDGARWPEAVMRSQLLVMLRVMLDFARPAQGLVIGADGLPQDLQAMLEQAAHLARDGAEPPRTLRNVRTGRPVDWRLAMAMLAFFRLFLDRPTLSLDEIGGAEVQRHQDAAHVAQTLRQAHQVLPLPAIRALLVKAHEAAVHPWVLDGFEREYRDLRLIQDATGQGRIALERITRYRPVKCVQFDRPHWPGLTYEWHEWNRQAAADLTLRVFDSRGRCLGDWPVPLVKRLDESAGFVKYEPAANLPSRVLQTFEALAHARPGQQACCEFVWREQMLLNLADRDLVVSYCPITSLKVRFDASANAQFLCSVGDSPGLARHADGWSLDRALLPREVLAVRIRWQGLTRGDAEGFGPSGDILSGPKASLRRA